MVIEARSRPRFSAAPHIRSIPPLSRPGVFNSTLALFDTGYQASPYRATRRSDGALSPPTQIGGCGLETGFGSNTTLSNSTYLPCIDGRSWVQRAFQAWIYSSVT